MYTYIITIVILEYVRVRTTSGQILIDKSQIHNRGLNTRLGFNPNVFYQLDNTDNYFIKKKFKKILVRTRITYLPTRTLLHDIRNKYCSITLPG